MKRTKRTIKLRVWRRDKFICQLRTSDDCIKKLDLGNATVDHILATANGGTDDLDNLTTACRPCNLQKAKKDQATREYTKAIRRINPSFLAIKN